MLVGNSQHTRVLVGPVQAAIGIAPHVVWDRLDSTATRSRRMRSADTRRASADR
jgi:hypothetical protein